MSLGVIFEASHSLLSSALTPEDSMALAYSLGRGTTFPEQPLPTTDLPEL